MRVDVWSDIVCPWCAIGRARLQRAIAEEGVDVEVRWRSFELDPNAPRHRDGTLAEHLSKKYGMPPDRVQAMQAEVTALGAAEGISFHFERASLANTFDAHRLLQAAQSIGRGGPMKARLFRAYFTDGVALSDDQALHTLAAEVGVPAATWAGDAFADVVRADERQAAELGIRGVPFFVFDQRYAVSGAQPVEVLRRALREAAASSGPASGEGPTC